MVRDFQDDSFVVEHVQGEVVLKLIGFSSSGPWRPQKLLLQLALSGWNGFYLDAFIGHWDHLDESLVGEVFEDYRDVPVVDYCNLLGLAGARLQGADCARGPHGTRIRLQTDRGTLLLREVDCSDAHSDSELAWSPNAAG